MRWDRYPSIEFVPDALLLVDPQGRIAEINRLASVPFGHDRGELIGRPAESLIAPEHRDAYLSALSDILSMRETGPVASVIDLSGRRKEGNEFAARILLTASVVGHSCHALNLFANPSDPSRTTNALLETLILFMSLRCASMEGFVVLQKDGWIQECNQEFRRLLGYDQGEFEEFNIFDLETAEESGTTKERLTQIGLNGWCRFQTGYRRKGATAAFLEINMGHFPTSDGGRWVGFAHQDCSGYGAELHTAALTAAAAAIMITDLDGRIVWANPAFTRLTGFAPSEYFGRSARLLASGRHPRSYYEEMWQTILRGDVWRGEIINRRKDGSLYAERMTIAPIRAHGQEITHFVAFEEGAVTEHTPERTLRMEAGPATKE